MAIYRAKRDKNFTIMSNTAIRDSNLSYKARGLLEYMLSMPDDWKFYEKDLVNRSKKDGRESVHNGIIELQKFGYVKKIPKRGEHGRFSSPDWLVSDIPENPPETGFPSTGKPDTVKPLTDNPQLLNTKRTKYLNNKELNKLSSSAKSDEEDKKKESILNEFNRIAQLKDDFIGEYTKPTVREWSAIKSLTKRLTIRSLQIVSINFNSAMHGYIEKPYPYLLKCLREQLEDQKMECKNENS